MPKLITKEQFIEKAKTIHGNKYDYSLTHYINNSIKVIIICSIHGEFEQTPANHLTRHGCPKCHHDKISEDRSSNKEEFVEKAKTIHGNKYNYSKVDYINNRIKVYITCLIDISHGDYRQSPNNHLRGKGCPKCKGNKLGSDRRLTLEQFIEKAKTIHGNKYNYSKSIPINYHKKIIIICSIHGEFEQTLNGHLQGQGCPSCNSSKGELALEEIFKKHNIQYEPQYNIPEIVANYEIDFYLPDYRLLVEFHGGQHYEYIPFFHDGNYSFEDQKNRDDMVRDAARRWKYRYLEFNYKQLKHMTKEQFEEMVINKINNIKILLYRITKFSDQYKIK